MVKSKGIIFVYPSKHINVDFSACDLEKKYAPSTQIFGNIQ